MPSCRMTTLILLFACCCVCHARADEGTFPFVVSYDAPANVTNVSSWLPRPAGADGFVQVKDGQFVVVRGGKAEPIRLWATNICFGANFPEREAAERLAARLAALGINAVRLHHMDSRDIWGKSPNKTTIDPDQLAKLDYLIFQFKQHGIYVNINLAVSRWLDEKDGFSDRELRPNYDKGLNNFEPRMIELQKKYARDLLAHVNPHTRVAYTDEPAVAMVEINNENALIDTWSGRKLDTLPDPYATTFRKLWNAWLRQKYGDTAKLRQAWNVGEHPLGDEMLKNGNFAQPLRGTWNLERDEQTGVEATTPDGAPGGGNMLRIVVTKMGKSAWHPQINQGGFAVAKETPYTFSFEARADQKRSLSLNAKQAHAPWQEVGLGGSVELGTEWKKFSRTFVSKLDDENARVGFTGFSPGTFEIANVSLRPGGIVGLAKGARLEDDSVPIVQRGDLNVTEATHRDFIQFLWDTERDYWSGMHRFLKDELKVRSLVAGTQLGWSPVYVQGALDYIDAHSYWQHPHFPGRPWDPRNWTVKNVALVNQPAGTLGGLAARRVAGMGFTVSEYNHPAPNEFRAEGFPMIAAFGALQAWDGIFHFAYSHNADFEPKRIQSFFDIKADTGRIVHMPACAAMFLRGDVQPARQLVAAPLSRQREQELLRQANSARQLTVGELGVDPKTSMLHRIGLDIDPAANAGAKAPELADVKRFVSDTGQIVWDVTRSGEGYFTVDTPRTKVFTGFVAGRSFDLGNVQLKIGATRRDWATVTLTCIDGRGFDQPGRVLVALTGAVENSGMTLERLADDKVTVGNQWGAEPVTCEGVPAEISLPVAAARVTLYSLDESGNRRAAVPVGQRAGKALLTLGPQLKTVWYEVEIR